METNEIPKDGPSNWQPITSKHDLAVLGKLIEETSELIGACARSIIQGIDEAEPVTGKINREWVEQEIADVMAMLQNARMRLNLRLDRERMVKKIDYKKPWFDALKARETDDAV